MVQEGRLPPDNAQTFCQTNYNANLPGITDRFEEAFITGTYVRTYAVYITSFLQELWMDQ